MQKISYFSTAGGEMHRITEAEAKEIEARNHEILAGPIEQWDQITYVFCVIAD